MANIRGLMVGFIRSRSARDESGCCKADAGRTSYKVFSSVCQLRVSAPHQRTSPSTLIMQVATPAPLIMPCETSLRLSCSFQSISKDSRSKLEGAVVPAALNPSFWKGFEPVVEEDDWTLDLTLPSAGRTTLI
jgi:hypothetical protein